MAKCEQQIWLNGVCSRKATVGFRNVYGSTYWLCTYHGRREALRPFYAEHPERQRAHPLIGEPRVVAEIRRKLVA